MRPYQNYLCFLVSKNLTYQEVLTELEDNNLHKIEPKDYDKIHEEIHERLSAPISNQLVDQRYDSNFLKWMKYIGLGQLWELEKKFITPQSAKLRLVYDIHQDPIMRISINCLLIKKVAYTDIVQDINMKYSYMLREEHVEIYRMFFFNPAIMSRKDWRIFLNVCGNTERANYFTALTEDLEVVKASLDLPVSVDLSKTLQSLLQSSTMKAKHYLKFNDNNSNKEARQWISTVLNVAGHYYKYSKADVGDFAKSIQMEFEFVETNFQTPDQEVLAEISKKQMPELTHKPSTPE